MKTPKKTVNSGRWTVDGGKKREFRGVVVVRWSSLSIHKSGRAAGDDTEWSRRMGSF
jgi:hypothetical protein